MLQSTLLGYPLAVDGKIPSSGRDNQIPRRLLHGLCACAKRGVAFWFLHPLGVERRTSLVGLIQLRGLRFASLKV